MPYTSCAVMEQVTIPFLMLFLHWDPKYMLENLDMVTEIESDCGVE